MLVLGAHATATANAPPACEARVRFERINGLSHNTVFAIRQDRQGFLWLGTADGLLRYDGYGFKDYRHDPRKPDSLAASTIRALSEDASGNLWIGTTRGLDRFDRAAGRFEHHLGDADVGGLIFGPDGNSWVLTYESGIYHYDPRSREVRDHWQDAKNQTVTRWREIVGRFGPDANVPLPAIELPDGTAARRVVKANDNTLWIGTPKGLYHADPEGGGVHRHGLSSDADALARFIWAIYEDHGGALWVGTRSGLYRYDPHEKPFAHLRPEAAGGASTVMAIDKSAHGELWLGTMGGGLLRLDEDSGEVLSHRPGGPSDHIWALCAADNETLWIGAEEGLFAVDVPTAQHTRYPLPSTHPYSPPAIYTIIEAPDGNLWIGGAWDVYRFDPRTKALLEHISMTRPDGFSTVQALHVDRRGTLWIGTEDDGLFRRDPAEQKLHRVDADLPGGAIWAIHESRDGKLWLGTNLALARFDPETQRVRQFYDPEALPGAIAYSLLEDESGRLWIGTSHGVARFDPRTERFRAFDTDDGIGNIEFNRRAALRAADGTFYFGGLHGLTAFDPAAIHDNPTVPPVVITGIQKSGPKGTVKLNPERARERGLVLSHEDRVFAFRFAALSFTDAHKNRYAYRLEGYDPTWVQAKTHRLARYTNVPPGEYVFRVKGSNNDGVWNEQGAAIRVTITPPYYETWWFRVLMAVSIFGLLAIAYRYRIAHLRRVERMRMRIAADLHDDIGSQLSSIALLSEMVRDRAELPAADAEELSRIGRVARRLVDGLREIVWFVDPAHDAQGALVWKMKTTAAVLLHGVAFTFEGPRHVPTTDVQLTRQVFLIYKEVLHNVARHAGATHVAIEVMRRHSELAFSVVDDGVGFDVEDATGGHGLRNIHRRAEKIGAKLEIESTPGKGTVVQLTVKTTK